MDEPHAQQPGAVLVEVHAVPLPDPALPPAARGPSPGSPVESHETGDRE
ncbi:hypothetical protein ACWD3Z_04055 [Streptomyces sp. NPDC002740]